MLLFAANNFLGKKIIEFAEENKIELFLIDLKKEKSKELEQEYGDHYLIYESLQKNDLEKIMNNFAKENVKFDYLIFNYYFKKLRDKKEEFSAADWDQLLEEWILNNFLIFKNVYPFLDKAEKSQVIYFNSARGYIGDNCIVEGGDIIEAGLAGGLTGMMTSIARETIPEGVSVNSIALSNDYREKWKQIKWVLTLWMAGIAEYSCAETIKIS